jgi:integrase/recombinase XerD
MHIQPLVAREQAGVEIRPQADTDSQVVFMWLHGRSNHTQRAYLADINRFLTFAVKPLREISLADIQGFAGSLEELAPASRHRILSTIKSLFAFAHRLGYVPFNAGSALKLPKIKATLAEKILSEIEVHRMLALEGQARNRILLLLLYAGGLRVSEICGLKWRDTQERGDGGQIAVYGKGGKTRVVLLSVDTWKGLATLRKNAGPDKPIFVSRKQGGHLDPSHVHRIVRSAAKRAGIDAPVSPHWLRHAHASHALNRGAPIHLVQATLGHASVATTDRYLHARPEDSSARYLADQILKLGN